jgi:hypothetical protein
MGVMVEPFDDANVRRCIRAILDGPGMTVFTRRARAEFLENDMTSADAVNVLRGGHISKGARTDSGWTYRAETQRMSVGFSFRGQERDSAAAPNELVIESARRNNR